MRCIRRTRRYREHGDSFHTFGRLEFHCFPNSCALKRTGKGCRPSDQTRGGVRFVLAYDINFLGPLPASNSGADTEFNHGGSPDARYDLHRRRGGRS
jgi:hypothetical protein